MCTHPPICMYHCKTLSVDWFDERAVRDMLLLRIPRHAFYGTLVLHLGLPTTIENVLVWPSSSHNVSNTIYVNYGTTSVLTSAPNVSTINWFTGKATRRTVDLCRDVFVCNTNKWETCLFECAAAVIFASNCGWFLANKRCLLDAGHFCSIRYHSPSRPPVKSGVFGRDCWSIRQALN